MTAISPVVYLYSSNIINSEFLSIQSFMVEILLSSLVFHGKVSLLTSFNVSLLNFEAIL